jgi:hypothetical protein
MTKIGVGQIVVVCKKDSDIYIGARYMGSNKVKYAAGNIEPLAANEYLLSLSNVPNWIKQEYINNSHNIISKRNDKIIENVLNGTHAL